MSTFTNDVFKAALTGFVPEREKCAGSQRIIARCHNGISPVCGREIPCIQYKGNLCTSRNITGFFGCVTDVAIFGGQALGFESVGARQNFEAEYAANPRLGVYRAGNCPVA